MNDRRLSSAAALGLLALLAVFGLPPSAGAQGETSPPARSRRLMRDINVLEKVIDQMLLDSKNLLVYTHENNTRGLYLDEFGVLFSFQASLVDREMGAGWAQLPNLKGLQALEGLDFKMEEKDGNIVIVRKPKNRSKTVGDPPDTPAPPSAPTPPEARAPRPAPEPRMLWRGEADGDQARLYAAGKTEITDTLLEYGDTMNSLRDDQWLGIAAFLRNSDYFIDNRIARLVVKARMRDLRAYAAGRLSRDQVNARVVIEEY